MLQPDCCFFPLDWLPCRTPNSGFAVWSTVKPDAAVGTQAHAVTVGVGDDGGLPNGDSRRGRRCGEEE